MLSAAHESANSVGPRILWPSRPENGQRHKFAIVSRATGMVAEEIRERDQDGTRPVPWRATVDTQTAPSGHVGRRKLCACSRLLSGRVLTRCAAVDWMVGGADPVAFTNYFTDVRAAQIRDMQEHLARKHNLPTFDFGANWEGLQHLQDKVHPKLVRLLTRYRIMQATDTCDPSSPAGRPICRRYSTTFGWNLKAATNGGLP